MYPSSFTSTDASPVYIYPFTYQQSQDIHPPLVLQSNGPPPTLAPNFYNSTNSALKVFDINPNREHVVNAIMPSSSVPHNSTHVNSDGNRLQRFDKIGEEQPYILPFFDGTDPRGWILEVSKYFEFKFVMDAVKIKAAGLHFVGRASTWYRLFYGTRTEEMEWEKFLHDLLVRFDDCEVDICNLVNPLSIQQRGSVNEYEIDFQKTKEIAEFVYDFVFTEEILAHNFVNGLKEDIRETIDLWSLKTLQGAVNWAKFQELQIEDRLLFEAAEEEYEMYEGMKSMFRENSAPSEVKGGTTPDVYPLVDVKVKPGDTQLGSKDFNKHRLKHFVQKDDKISQLDDELIHINFLVKDRRKRVEACDAQKRNSLYKLTRVAASRKGTPVLNEVPLRGSKNEPDDFILKVTAVILDLYCMHIMYDQTAPIDVYGPEKFFNVGKPNVHNFDPGGGALIVIQAAISRGQEHNMRPDLSLPDITPLLLGNLLVKFLFGDLGSNPVEKGKDACSLCKCVSVDLMLGHSDKVPQKELAQWNIDDSYAIKELLYEKLFDWFCFETRNDVVSAEYFASLAMLVSYIIYIVMLKCRGIRTYSPNFGLLIKLVVGNSLSRLYTDHEIANSMLSLFEHFGLLDNGFQQISMEMEMQLDKVGEYEAPVMKLMKMAASGYTDLVMKILNDFRKTHKDEVLQYDAIYKGSCTNVSLNLLFTRILCDNLKKPEPYRPRFTRLSVHHTSHEVNTLSCHLNAKAVGCHTSMVGMRDTNLLNLTALIWRLDNASIFCKKIYSLDCIGLMSGIVLVPGGVWSTVGVTGLIYGGSCGSLRRKHGLIADNVLDARIVDVYGNILDRKTGKKDLFWTIRSGCFTFGVILSWTLNLVDIPAELAIFTVSREEKQTKIIYHFQTFAPVLPNGLDIRLLQLITVEGMTMFWGGNSAKVIEKNSIPPKSRNGNLSRLVYFGNSWEGGDELKQEVGSVEFLQYRQHATCSDGFKVCEAHVLPTLHVTKKMARAWYWSIIFLVFDPGALQLLYSYIKFYP